MKFHASIAWAAMAAALAVPAAAQAKAHAKPHHRAPAAGAGLAAELRIAQEQIAQLTAQVNALQAKTDAAASQQVATAQVAAQSQAAAETASAAAVKADTALAHADAAQKAAAHPAVPEAVKWAANTTVGSTVFFNMSNINQKTNVATNPGGKNANSGTGFNIKRVYLSVNHTFNNTFSAAVVADISNVIGETATTNYVTPAITTSAPTCTTTSPSAGKYVTTCTAPTSTLGTAALDGKGFYVKNAFLQAKINPALIIRAGAAPLPWVPYVEGLNGHRYVDNMMIDRLSYGTTADWGLHALGDVANGHVSYAVAAVDGGGYRNVKVTNHVDFEGRLSGQYDGFNVAIGGYIGKRANQTQYVESAAGVITPTSFRTAKRWDAVAAYKNDLFTIGGEYFHAKNWNNVTVNPSAYALSQDAAEGFSAFGTFNVNKQWSVFGRYDWAKPNKITDPALRDHYLNAGIQWEPIKLIDLSLVYKHETAKNGAVSSTDGVVGCATSATANSFASLASQTSGICSGNGTYDEIGLFGQLKF